VVVDGGVGEGGAADVVLAEVGVPLAVEVVDLEAPLLLGFEGVHDLLEVPTVGTMRREVLYELEAELVFLYLALELLVTDEVGVGHVPLLAVDRPDRGHGCYQERDHQGVSACWHL
jgi:hypothetical protein